MSAPSPLLRPQMASPAAFRDVISERPMLKTIVIVLVLLVVAVAAVLAYAATNPPTFRAQDTAGIKAPPEKIFALINDMRGWGPWSPYEKKAPAMKRAYHGQES